MNLIFFGTPDYAKSVLEAVLATDNKVCLVVTRADKPKGRGNKIEFSPVKQLALERGIPVYQPASLKDPETQEFLRLRGADMFLTAAYGRIFPKEVLDMPPRGCVNIHASLLPSLRGASPINRAIINGDTEGGVTVMMMDEGIDTGDMLLIKKTPIPENITFGDYYNTVSRLASEAAVEFLMIAAEGLMYRTPQDASRATYADKVTKEDEKLDFSQDSAEVYNRIRGLSPEPCAYTYIAGKRVKIYSALRGSGSGEPGNVITADKNGIEIACGSGSVILTEIQPESKSRMSAAAFLAGNKII